jgi:BASS family bile acid:Na+ symporter
VLSVVANFVLAPLGLWRGLGLDEPLGIGLLLCGLAAGGLEPRPISVRRL